MLIARLCCLFFGATICLGLYVDHSSNAKRLEQFKAAEQAILQKLGLQSRPNPQKGSKERIPQFILDLYHNHVSDPEWLSTNFRNKGKWTSANTIRAFDHEGERMLALSHSDCAQVKNWVKSFPDKCICKTKRYHALGSSTR